MKYYTYKITFKDLPGYFYYGYHRDNGKPYFGSPTTWACFWMLFEAEIQILQWYETAEEVKAAEEAIIRATWDSKYSLNENTGGLISEEVCRKNGKKNGKKTAAANLVPNCSANGRKNVEVMLAHPNTIANRVENGAKTGAANGGVTSKRILLANMSTGETFEFPSASEAARSLGLDQGCLSSVARGGRKQHKRYTAVYI
jgi:hypothetical protein